MAKKPTNKIVRTGLDVLVANDFKNIAGAKLGLLANAASVDCQIRHIVSLIKESKTCSLVKLFAPEHGFFGTAQDMVSIEDSLAEQLRIPIVSLYGDSAASLTPRPEDLDGIDLLLCDLPDIGSRYYTFAQTIGYCMQACAEAGVKVVIIDRPNPISGVAIEGAALTKRCRSFCGYAPVANRHGLTMGELALVMNKGFGSEENAIPPIGCNLEVVKIENWERSQYLDNTDLPWIMPSPNMPTLDSAIVYPGMCLFEATTISEGRGTTRPFELIGAPYIDGARLAKETLLQSKELTGAILRPVQFEPQFQKWAKHLCGGIQIHVTDRTTFRPFRWAIALLSSVAKLYPEEFSWREKAYEFIDNIPAVDVLFGSEKLRRFIDTKSSIETLFAELAAFEQIYAEERQKFLLYN